ncbi:MAG: helix-turn-helix domain-containing protein [Oscillospiraceae bacterium]|nr:helix-turn-helix domain-containing protein [Oscillospiraceae bacterium]
MDIGMHIKAARRNAGLTQEQLAKKCNLATITIRQYELGKREPKMEQLSSLADALNVHVLELLGYPANRESAIQGSLRFSVEAMANRIAKKYCLPIDAAQSIVADCYEAMQKDGQEISKTATMAGLFDALEPDHKLRILDDLKKLIQEDSRGESAGEC